MKVEMIRSKIRRFIANHQNLTKRLLTVFIRMHNYSYHKISELAGYLNNDVHPKHSITNYHAFFVDHVDSNDRVIDLGSGSGFLAFDIAKKAKSVLGIEISENNVSNAKRDFYRDNLFFTIGDITEYQPTEKFDKAVLSNVLEHIENRVKLLRQVRNYSPVLLVRVPMITRDWITVYKKHQGFEYRLDQTHFVEYTLEQFFEETKEGGWKVDSYQVNWGELWAVLKAENK
ncbi:MAG: hypothetical protein A3E94_01230 [Candidatus Zambryskibacteria bacterium RIFCSPHIGHO2_12_FULL_44_12b]|uniref:Methyltransferase domain-containing protein n=1 Tax=Candidatus Zambryskibacteria bacterium RIFCSPLOWO2_01_FULL_45_21 TaxID=1802761 RepID=A0A1G2U1Q4_9BACT|nr:MAG: hypothetical protein A3E94_01230 [Candidatus Zambryskibacteria bacterium RIFCSPHIGHO2_12_FULL_44_12b]OHB03455.1 MAG: hypothetical protein A3B14_02910 [Candidatus Zambryskibacteria bacterium RIFCSPLOWO2_01_FULL_45_21]